jgi:OOP family OmpA-OmpF porin
MAGLRALSALHEGQMTLEPDTLRIRGRTGDQALRAELTRQLSEELGRARISSSTSSMTRRSTPSHPCRPPEECVADIVAVQEETRSSSNRDPSRYRSGR